jgi:hypothetical protein
MALTLYKEINATGNSTGGFLNFIRWLTGESRGDLASGRTTGPVGITVVEVYDGDGVGLREVPNYSGVFTVIDNAQVTDGDTITIEDPDGGPASETYTARAGAPGANEFQIGASAAITATNLAAAITTNPVGTSEALSVGDAVSFNTNDSAGAQWNLTTSRPAAIAVSGATTASGKLDGLSATNEFRTSAVDINDGWIIIDVPGTLPTGSPTGFQWCYQFTGVTGSASDGFALIPNRDWTPAPGAGALWSDKATFLAAGSIVVATTPTNVTGSWTATDTWFAWCDEGTICFVRDEDPVASLQLWYVGEVDGGDPADTKPFVIGDQGSMTLSQLQADDTFRRISPKDGTTEISGSENWGFNHFDASNAWSAGQTQFINYGPGWPRSDQWVAFDDVNHAHFAGKLRYVQRTMNDAAIRGTSDSLTRWLSNIGSGSELCVSLPWDGATAYP